MTSCIACEFTVRSYVMSQLKYSVNRSSDIVIYGDTVCREIREVPISLFIFHSFEVNYFCAQKISIMIVCFSLKFDRGIRSNG